MDSNSAFRATLGGLAGPRDARSGRGDRSHQSSFRLTAINKHVRRAISWLNGPIRRATKSHLQERLYLDKC